MAQYTVCGDDSLLLNLSDDILGIIGTSLSIRDVCNLSICCKNLNLVAASDKIWFSQCNNLGVISSSDLVEWQNEVVSYKALCRFLTIIEPLLGIWVHQNPELGNVVNVMPGFASVVGCRVIPQTVRDSSIEGSPLLWAPVFEVVSDYYGTPVFFLHGRENGRDYVYPGTLNSVEKTCTVLLLEVEPKSERLAPFSELSFDDRETLLEIVTGSVCVQLPDSTCDSLFPHLRDDEDKFRTDLARLSERREVLMKLRELDKPDIRDELAKFPEFLSLGNTVELTLKASTTELHFYQAWPDMDDTTFALYKLPIQVPTFDKKYAGLWGGTFSNPTENNTGKALFFVVLSYDSGSSLIATKILEGTDYVLYPNGSALFIVDVNNPSTESFPGDSGGVGVTQAFTGEGICDGYGFRYPGSTRGVLFALEDDTLVFVWKDSSRSVFMLQRLNLDELLKKGERVLALNPVANFSYLNRFYANVFA